MEGSRGEVAEEGKTEEKGERVMRKDGEKMEEGRGEGRKGTCVRGRGKKRWGQGNVRVKRVREGRMCRDEVR